MSASEKPLHRRDRLLVGELLVLPACSQKTQDAADATVSSALDDASAGLNRATSAAGDAAGNSIGNAVH